MFFITEQLKEKYGFYAKFHKNFLNKITHFICIPLLAFSAFVMLDYIQITFDINEHININNTNFNKTYYEYNECYGVLYPSSILYLIYFIYYLLLTPFYGLIANAFYFCVLFSSQVFYCRVDDAYIYAIGIHIGSWIFQLLGHKLCEGNKPAFLDGIGDSFMVAPLFVVIDFFKMFCSCCCPYLKALKPHEVKMVRNAHPITSTFIYDELLSFDNNN